MGAKRYKPSVFNGGRGVWMEEVTDPDKPAGWVTEADYNKLASGRGTMETFEQWWTRSGKFIDPDTEDVPWFDKRKSLAEAAFEAAKAQSGNYTANDSVMPDEVTFGNGRIVKIADNKNPNVHLGVFLEVSRVEEV